MTRLIAVLLAAALLGTASAAAPYLTASVNPDGTGWLYDITAHGATGDDTLGWKSFTISGIKPYTPDGSYFRGDTASPTPVAAHYDPATLGSWFGYLSQSVGEGWLVTGDVGGYVSISIPEGYSLEPGESFTGFKFWRPFTDGWVGSTTYLGADTTGAAYGSGTLDFGKDPNDPGEVTPELSSASLLLLGMLPVGLAWWRRRKS